MLYFSETSYSLLVKRREKPWLHSHISCFLPWFRVLPFPPFCSTNSPLSSSFSSLSCFFGTKSQPTSYSCANKHLENHFTALINVQWIAVSPSRTDGYFVDPFWSVEQSCVICGKVCHLTNLYQKNIIKNILIEKFYSTFSMYLFFFT